MPRMNLKIKTVLAIYTGLQELRAFETRRLREDPKWPGLDKRLVYAVVKNRSRLEPIVQAMMEMQRPSEALLEFEKERLVLAKSHARKDANGIPVTANGEFVVQDAVAFGNAFASLKAEYGDELGRRQESQRKIREKLNEEEDADLCLISFEFLPATIPIAIYEKLDAIMLNSDGVSASPDSRPHSQEMVGSYGQ
jgi:hypothetical protein